MRFTKFDTDIRTNAKRMFDSIKTHPKTQSVVESSKQVVTYCKENPDQVLLGIVALLIADQADDIEDISDATTASAIVDINEYYGR